MNILYLFVSMCFVMSNKPVNLNMWRWDLLIFLVFSILYLQWPAKGDVVGEWLLRLSELPDLLNDFTEILSKSPGHYFLREKRVQSFCTKLNFYILFLKLGQPFAYLFKYVCGADQFASKITTFYYRE